MLPQLKTSRALFFLLLCPILLASEPAQDAPRQPSYSYESELRIRSLGTRSTQIGVRNADFRENTRRLLPTFPSWFIQWSSTIHHEHSHPLVASFLRRDVRPFSSLSISWHQGVWDERWGRLDTAFGCSSVLSSVTACIPASGLTITGEIEVPFLHGSDEGAILRHDVVPPEAWSEWDSLLIRLQGSGLLGGSGGGASLEPINLHTSLAATLTAHGSSGGESTYDKDAHDPVIGATTSARAWYTIVTAHVSSNSSSLLRFRYHHPSPPTPCTATLRLLVSTGSPCGGFDGSGIPSLLGYGPIISAPWSLMSLVYTPGTLTTSIAYVNQPHPDTYLQRRYERAMMNTSDTAENEPSIPLLPLLDPSKDEYLPPLHTASGGEARKKAGRFDAVAMKHESVIESSTGKGRDKEVHVVSSPSSSGTPIIPCSPSRFDTGSSIFKESILLYHTPLVMDPFSSSPPQRFDVIDAGSIVLPLLPPVLEAEGPSSDVYVSSTVFYPTQLGSGHTLTRVRISLPPASSSVTVNGSMIVPWFVSRSHPEVTIAMEGRGGGNQPITCFPLSSPLHPHVLLHRTSPSAIRGGPGVLEWGMSITQMEINEVIQASCAGHQIEHIILDVLIRSNLSPTLGLLHAEEYPPDTHRGFNLLPDRLTITAGEGRMLFDGFIPGPPPIIELPSPDFSMPYNVMTLILTGASFVIGGLTNQILRKPRIKKVVAPKNK